MKLLLLLEGWRQAKPTWGPKKIKFRLEELHPGVAIPAASTIGDILERNGLIQERIRKQRVIPYEEPLSISRTPNDLWGVDFKGQFRLGNSMLCYPLTVTDHFSRYLLACEALNSVCQLPVIDSFQEIFETYGVPAGIRTDNGVPFANTVPAVTDL